MLVAQSHHQPLTGGEDARDCALELGDLDDRDRVRTASEEAEGGCACVRENSGLQGERNWCSETWATYDDDPVSVHSSRARGTRDVSSTPSFQLGPRGGSGGIDSSSVRVSQIEVTDMDGAYKAKKRACSPSWRLGQHSLHSIPHPDAWQTWNQTNIGSDDRFQGLRHQPL
ncbi:hypothetical protein GE09DRAFT_1160384 [Coniochaeta sp. 2T2.1]|nr:hypothetical protein GE09DRAFT_1160384 [Coniochaeta sp. 2T2.1]